MSHLTYSDTACLQSWGELGPCYGRRPGWEESSAGVCRHTDAAAGRWDKRPDTRPPSIFLYLLGADLTNMFLCVYRYCSCHRDSSGDCRDVLWSRPSVHTHHSPAAGVWPTGPENSRQIHPAERIPQQGVYDIRAAWLFLLCTCTHCELLSSFSFRLSRAAWWRACQGSGSSPGNCVCLSSVLLLLHVCLCGVLFITTVSHKQGVGPCTDRGNPDERTVWALPALFTSSHAGWLWSWGCSERYTR